MSSGRGFFSQLEYKECLARPMNDYAYYYEFEECGMGNVKYKCEKLQVLDDRLVSGRLGCVNKFRVIVLCWSGSDFIRRTT